MDVMRRKLTQTTALMAATHGLAACGGGGGDGAVAGPAPAPAPSPGTPVWPLAVHSSGRRLVDGNGAAFLVVGDTPWSLAVNCTNEQIDRYLTDRAIKGCSAILINAIERA